MNRLQEKRSLVALARRFGQEPAADLLEEIAVLERDEQQRLQREARIRASIAQDLSEIFNSEVPHELVSPQPTKKELHEQPKQSDNTTVTATEPAATATSAASTTPTTVQRVAQYIAETGVVAPDPVLAQPQKDLEREIKYLREWVSRIAATGPGGGAAQIYNLDIPAKSVDGDYTLGRRDYYVGVSSLVKTYITLPDIGSNVKEGRVVVIKDESGHAQLTPIKIVGTIDNDPNGAEIRINNGAVQLVYHNGGWRII